VKEFLFGSFDVPLANLAASLRTYVCFQRALYFACFNRIIPYAMLTSSRTSQEPSEEPFDISLVSREAKSQPLQDKKAPGKKAPAGAPALAPVSAVDAYQKVLSSITEFSGFGRLFKVCRVNTF
jgi:coatomer protein complex subunit gamma